MSEVWKDVVGYEGIYKVSESGKVESVKRVDSHGVPRGGHLMTPRKEKSGYLSVPLRKDGVLKRRKVHSLVIEAFIGPKPSPDCVCRHLDDCKTNNTWVNLAWGTSTENKADAKRNGKIAVGERNGGGGVLTESQVIEIKRRISAGEAKPALANEFGVSRGMIYHIDKGRAWSHV